MDKLPVDSDTAEQLTLGTDTLTVLATSAETGGALFAVMVRMPPGGGPPVMHRHDPGEVYYVVDGQFTFYIGGPDAPKRINAGPGRSFLSSAARPTRFATSPTRTPPPLSCTPLAPLWRTSPAPRQLLPSIDPRAWRLCWPSLNGRALSCWDPSLSLSHGQPVAHTSWRSRSRIPCQD